MPRHVDVDSQVCSLRRAVTMGWMMAGTRSCGGAGRFAALAAGAALIAGCGGGDPAPDREATLVDAERDAPVVLNVVLPEGASAVTQRIASTIQQNLLTADDAGRTVPQLAREVPSGQDVQAGPLRVTFHLRPEARWSDGRPVTSADAVFTWRTMADPGNRVASQAGWREIRAVRPGRTATGASCAPRTCFTVEFRGDYAPWRDLFSVAGATYLLPEHVLRGKDFDTVWNRGGIVGSGPFELESFRPGERAVVRRDPDWWGAPAGSGGADIARIVFDFRGSAAAALTAVRAGEAQMAPLDPDPALLRRAEAIDGTEVVSVASLFFEHVILNTSRPPLDDPLVRRALAHAIDRAQIAEVLLDGQVDVLQSPIRPQQLGYAPAFEEYDHDPVQAEALLAEAGWTREGDGIATRDGEPLRIELATEAGNTLRATTARLIAEQARAAGIEVVPRSLSPDRLYGEALFGGDFDAAMLAFGGGLDPSLTDLLASDRIPSEENDFSGQNVYRWSDPTADSLMRRSDGQIDDAARARTLTLLQERIASQVPLIPLYQQANAAVHVGALRGVTENPTLAEVFWNSGDWSLGG